MKEILNLLDYYYANSISVYKMANFQKKYTNIEIPQIAPSQLWNTEFAFPRELRKRLSDPAVERSLKLAELTLPRIIAVKHEEVVIPVLKKFIEKLPPKSKIFLEMSIDPVSSPEFYKHLRGGSFFNPIAEFAQQKGHSIVWMERRLSRFTENEKKLLAAVERNLIERSKHPEGSLPFVQLARERFKLFDKLGMTPGHTKPPFTSEWRSHAMARILLREQGHKPTDIAICGTAHAVNLSHILERPVEMFIGHYESKKLLIQEVKEVMLEQHVLSGALGKARTWGKFVRRVKGMIPGMS